MSDKYFSFEINKVCSQPILCKDKDCQKDHPRCYAGLCVDNLRGQCKCSSEQKQQLYHFHKQLMKSQEKGQKINGVYNFNLCLLQNKCPNLNNFKCPSLHRQWAENYCVKYLNDICNDECQNNHIEWDELHKQVSLNYKVLNQPLESICDKENFEACTCGQQHPELLKKVCIGYFNGKCKSIRNCFKKHLDWEEVSKNPNLLDLKSNMAVPCTIVPLLTNQVQEEQKNQAASQAFQLYYQDDKDQFQVKALRKEIKEKYNIDVLIIMDCTESMEKWITSAYETICKLIMSLKMQTPGYFFRLAFVGYRDFADNNDRIAYHDFTEDIDVIKNFIKQQKATGGGDTAEDVIGGLEQGLKLNFCKHPESILQTILICDAPSHGKQYYDLNIDLQEIKQFMRASQLNKFIEENQLAYDSKRDEIKVGTLEKIMDKYQELKKNNFFTCITINKETEKMFKIMQSRFKTLIITNTQKPDQLAEKLKYTLKSSIENTVQLKSTPDEIFVNAKFQLIEFPPLPSEKEGDACYWEGFPELLKKSIITGTTTLRISRNQLDKDLKNKDKNLVPGQNSYVFSLFDSTNNRKMIAKIPKDLVDLSVEIESIKLIYEKLLKQTKLNEKVQMAKENFECRFYSSAYACQLAKAFRKKTYKINSFYPIFYAPPVLYELENEFWGTKYLYAETYIDIDNKWVKYTNNDMYADKQHPQFPTFTHFTFEETCGRLMITDIQGKQNILSDPAIHTDHVQVLKDTTNKGNVGFGVFVEGQHQNCNDLCEKMSLERKYFEDIDARLYDTDNEDTSSVCKKKKEKKIESIKVKEWQDTDKIIIICDLCNEMRRMTYKRYKESMGENSERSECEHCQAEMKFTTKSICKCCEEQFTFNPYQSYRVYKKYPDICQFCSQCQDSTIKCIYCERKCKIAVQQKQGQYLCKISQKYLTLLKCNCNKYFKLEEDTLLDQNSYMNGKFICTKCNK